MAVSLDFDGLKNSFFAAEELKSKRFDPLFAAENILFEWSDFSHVDEYSAEEYLTVLTNIQGYLERGYLTGVPKATIYDKLMRLRPVSRRRLL